VTSKPRAGESVFFRADSIQGVNMLTNRYRTDAFSSLAELFRTRTQMLETPDRSMDQILQTVAEELGVEVEQARLIMQGENKPSQEAARKIAKILDIPKAQVDGFYSDDEDGEEDGEMRGDEEILGQLDDLKSMLSEALSDQARGDAEDGGGEGGTTPLEALDLPGDLGDSLNEAVSSIDEIEEQVQSLKDQLEEKEQEKKQIEKALEKLKGKFAALTSTESAGGEDLDGEGSSGEDAGGENQLRGDADDEDPESDEQPGAGDGEDAGDEGGDFRTDEKDFEEYMEEKSRLAALADRYNIDSASEMNNTQLRHEIAKEEVGEDEYKKDSNFVEGVLEGLQSRNDALEKDASELSEIFGSVESSSDDGRREEQAERNFNERMKNRSKKSSDES